MVKKLVAADLSIIEILVFGFVELFSFSMLVISVIKEIPNTRASSIVRAIYLLPGMIAAGLMSAVNHNITFNIIQTNSTTFAANGTLLTNMTQKQMTYLPLENPMWSMFHFLIMIVLLLFFFQQMFNLLTKPE